MTSKVKELILLNASIGSPEDVTPRVQAALRDGVVFAAEDTRKLMDLMSRLGIAPQGKKLISYHDHSSIEKAQYLLSELQEEKLFFISDAGSPVLSDPAYPLVQAALLEGIKVESYSGISAVTMALELSALPPIPFTFHGFLPREAGKIKSQIESLDLGTHIFFESPHRVEESCNLLETFYPNLDVVLLKELTKTYQSIYRFKARDWMKIKGDVVFKGEFVLVLYQPQEKAQMGEEALNLAQEVLSSGGAYKPLSKLLSLVLNEAPKKIYQELVKNKPF